MRGDITKGKDEELRERQEKTGSTSEEAIRKRKRRRHEAKRKGHSRNKTTERTKRQENDKKRTITDNRGEEKRNRQQEDKRRKWRKRRCDVRKQEEPDPGQFLLPSVQSEPSRLNKDAFCCKDETLKVRRSNTKCHMFLTRDEKKTPAVRTKY